MAKIRWTEIILHFADGSGLKSEWNAELAHAVQSGGGKAMDIGAATEEHLRALAEIQDSDACANWFTNAQLSEKGPRRDDIDWTGFVGSYDDES